MTNKFFNEITKSIEWNGKTLTISTGKMARLAEGAVVVQMGDTVVLCAVTAAKQAKEGIDFFPLTVNLIEKFYAGGKIPGGFKKREGAATEREVLGSRLIDRPIRPLFQEGFNNEVQICCTVVSYDPDCESDILGLIGASAALAISGLPFLEPVAGARVGYIDGEYVLNPTMTQAAQSKLELIVAGTQSSVLMVESEVQQLSEEVMLGAVMYGHEQIQPVIAMIQELAKEAGKPRWDVVLKDKKALSTQIESEYSKALEAAYKKAEKSVRRELIAEIKAKMIEKFVQDQGLLEFDVNSCFKKLEKKIVRGQVIKNNLRIDGRDPDTIRPIVCEVDLLPRPHGSALFTRGETQALVVTTLGIKQDEQLVDNVKENTTEKFLLHYNFPPYSVGEVGAMRGPGRREIGHGNLAARALRPVLPAWDDFSYTIRVVSEITESNGSSSMATVCGGGLSMMAAGVPLIAPVAGIAMGLILEGKDFVVLSDILGDEDYLGDMDFKVAGTAEGITALQMDIKVNGINKEIMEVALAKAKIGRMHILDKMNGVLGQARTELSGNAPRITTIKIDKDKIREVIGSGGKVIRELCERANAKIDIEDDGTIKIATVTAEDTALALQLISAIVATPEVGKIYEGKVVKITDFGAFVNYLGNQEGLLHISEMGSGERVAKVTDIVQEGQTISVKLLSVERNGKVRLTMRLDSEIPPSDGSGSGPSGERKGRKPERSGGRSNRSERGERNEHSDRNERSSSTERSSPPREKEETTPQEQAPKEHKRPRNDEENNEGSGSTSSSKKRRFF